jgi:hypothetical protein
VNLERLNEATALMPSGKPPTSDVILRMGDGVDALG